MQTVDAAAVADSMPTPSVKESTPLHVCEPIAPPRWISHLEGRTLVCMGAKFRPYTHRSIT
jgi:hypothetical protein